MSGDPMNSSRFVLVFLTVLAFQALAVDGHELGYFEVRFADRYLCVPASFRVLGPNSELGALIELVAPSALVPAKRQGPQSMARLYIGKAGIAGRVVPQHRLAEMGTPTTKSIGAVEFVAWPKPDGLPVRRLVVLRYQKHEAVFLGFDTKTVEKMAGSVAQPQPAFRSCGP